MWPWQQLLRHGLFRIHFSGWLVVPYKAEAAVLATLMCTLQTMLYNIVCAPA